MVESDIKVAHPSQERAGLAQSPLEAPDALVLRVEVAGIEPRGGTGPPGGNPHVVHILDIIGVAHARFIDEHYRQLFAPDAPAEFGEVQPAFGLDV